MNRENKDEKLVRKILEKKYGIALIRPELDPPDYIMKISCNNQYAVEATRVMRQFKSDTPDRQRSYR